MQHFQTRQRPQLVGIVDSPSKLPLVPLPMKLLRQPLFLEHILCCWVKPWWHFLCTLIQIGRNFHIRYCNEHSNLWKMYITANYSKTSKFLMEGHYMKSANKFTTTASFLIMLKAKECDVGEIITHPKHKLIIILVPSG